MSNVKPSPDGKPQLKRKLLAAIGALLVVALGLLGWLSLKEKEFPASNAIFGEERIETENPSPVIELPGEPGTRSGSFDGRNRPVRARRN